MKRTILALSLVVGFATQALAADDIRIGVIVPLTGLSQDLGSASRNGTQLAASEINQRGGILGRQIVLVVYDDKGNPAHAEKVAAEAIANGKLDAMLGTINTGVAIKTMPMYQKARIPTIITSSIGSAPGVLTKYMAEPISYIFRTNPPDFTQVEAIMRELKAKNMKKVQLFGDASPFGQSGIDQLKKALEAAKMEVASIERFEVGTRDFEPLLIKARSIPSDATVVWGLGHDQAALKVGMNRIGWRPPLYGCYTLAQMDYVNSLGSNANGTRIAMAYTVDSERPVAKNFLKGYKAQNNQNHPTSPLTAASGFDAMYLYALAVKQAGTTNPEKVVAALENLETPYSGVMKDVVKPYSKTNHELFPDGKDVYIAVAKDGIVVRDDHTADVAVIVPTVTTPAKQVKTEKVSTDKAPKDTVVKTKISKPVAPKEITKS